MPLDLQYTQFLQDSMQAGHEPVVSHNYSKITQQNGGKTTTEKRLRVTNATGLFRACFVVIFTWYYCVLVFYKKILSLSHKVCRLLSSAVLADERKKRASREKANERKTEGKEGAEPVSSFFKYLNPPTNPWASWKNRFSCQNVKRCGVGEFHLLDMFVRLCAREAKWLT